MKFVPLNEKIADLDLHRNRLVDRNGGWIIGEGVFTEGENLLKEILGKKSYFYLLTLNATGKKVDENFCKWLEAGFMCLSWPEPRIWCNTIGSLGGSSRATVLSSTVAGILASDSLMYGTGFYLELSGYLNRLLDMRLQGYSAKQIVREEVDRCGGKVKMLGFARPIAKGDERVVEMLAYAKQLGFSHGEYMKLVLDIENVLMEGYGESLNIGGYLASFLMDQGFEAQQIYNLLAIYVNSGITACYRNELERPAGYFLPQVCDDVEYTGPNSRELPSRYKG